MHIRADADHIAILNRTIDIMENALPNNSFKLMVDRQTLNALIQADPPEFFWNGTENGGNRYRNRPLLHSDLINGIWIHIH